jgi:hypothetical protein
VLSLVFRERTHGSLHLHDEPLHVRAVDAVFEFHFSLIPEAFEKKTLSLSGTIDIEGIATGARHRGSVLVHWGKEQRIRYDFRFESDAGVPMRILGQKDFMVISPVGSLTKLPFLLYEGDDHEIGSGEVELDLRNGVRRGLWTTVKSLRLSRTVPAAPGETS